MFEHTLHLVPPYDLSTLRVRGGMSLIFDTDNGMKVKLTPLAQLPFSPVGKIEPVSVLYKGGKTIEVNGHVVELQREELLTLKNALHESLALGNLCTSPHIVKTYNYGTGWHNYGGKLAHISELEHLYGFNMQYYSCILPADASKIVLHLIIALKEMAQYGIVHRDLKPGNIIYDPGVLASGGYGGRENKATVIDLGICRKDAGTPIYGAIESHFIPLLLDEELDRGEITGTMGYLSPEQACCSPLTIRSDWFNLGLITYFVFTGENLFTLTSEREVQEYLRVMLGYDNTKRDFLLEYMLDHGLPRELASPVSSLLDESPKSRDFGELEEVVRRWAH